MNPTSWVYSCFFILYYEYECFFFSYRSQNRVQTLWKQWCGWHLESIEWLEPKSKGKETQKQQEKQQEKEREYIEIERNSNEIEPSEPHTADTPMFPAYHIDVYVLQSSQAASFLKKKKKKNLIQNLFLQRNYFVLLPFISSLGTLKFPKKSPMRNMMMIPSPNWSSNSILDSIAIPNKLFGIQLASLSDLLDTLMMDCHYYHVNLLQRFNLLDANVEVSVCLNARFCPLLFHYFTLMMRMYINKELLCIN